MSGFQKLSDNAGAQSETHSLANQNADNTSRAALTGVSVVIPARNEERSLGMIIQRSLPFCDEVVVVDGHSTDGTVQVAKKHGVKVVHDHRKGKGDAIRVGAQAATQDVVVFIDADGSHDPADIPRLVAPILHGESDLVIGSRGKGGSDELHGDMEKLFRLVGSDLILIGINWRFKARLTDSQNGFRAIKEACDLGTWFKGEHHHH